MIDNVTSDPVNEASHRYMPAGVKPPSHARGIVHRYDKVPARLRDSYHFSQGKFGMLDPRQQADRDDKIARRCRQLKSPDIASHRFDEISDASPQGVFGYPAEHGLARIDRSDSDPTLSEEDSEVARASSYICRGGAAFSDGRCPFSHQSHAIAVDLGLDGTA